MCCIFFVLFLAGCGGSLFTSWNNFTAYYNTFYNAKQDFRAGVKKVEQQPVQLNPETPVRPHPAPVNAGAENFEEAITKGALVLRRHADSKWFDNALLLIGKSYYYQQEFFLAVQTFEQLIDQERATRLKQEAILWKGRALLDIAAYGEGIQFLQTQLADLVGNWNPHLKAEANVLLGEHYAMMEDWEAASQVLEPALLRLNDNKLKGRSYFLLGQTLEKTGDLSRAFQAYSNVAKFYPDYEYIYWANINRAEVIRRNGDADLAVSIYKTMLKDDKNIDRRSTILFQLARTYEQEGNPGQADAMYKRILRDPAAQRTALIGDTYYQLGELYSREYGNFQLAAAYYDSASAVATQQNRNDSEKALQLASAYGDYLALKNEVADVDSLLRLSTLNKQELDSVLTQLRQMRRAMIGTHSNDQQEDILSNTTPTGVLESQNAAETSAYGFLNYRNARMVAAAEQQFRARWGNRPLVDNWRRTNAILSTSDESQFPGAESPERIIAEGQFTDQQLGIDLSEIPMTPQAVTDLRAQRVRLEYQLGNLFFLTLNQPDSAKYYFEQVLRDSSYTRIQPQALYSLFRLYEREGRVDSAAFYKNQILREYPETVYAEHVKEEEGKAITRPDSTRELRRQVQQLLFEQANSPPSITRAEALRTLAMQHKTSPLAPAIFYEGIKEYIQVAKNAAPETTMLKSDTTFVADTLQGLTYRGERWNRVRELLQEFEEVFPAADQTPRVRQWAQLLAQPSGDKLLTCRDAGVTPVIRPDLETFLQAVRLPGNLSDLNLSGTIIYRFIINPQGNVESYELISKPTGLGIEAAYEKTIQDKLQFEPIMVQNQPVTISCEVAFPIKQ